MSSAATVTPPGQGALQELLQGMAAEYARGLPEKLSEIESLWRGIAAGNDSRRGELLRAAHSMAGAAGTFGLPGLGRAARELELVLEPSCARAAALDDAERIRIENGIAGLLRAVA